MMIMMTPLHLGGRRPWYKRGQGQGDGEQAAA